MFWNPVSPASLVWLGPMVFNTQCCPTHNVNTHFKKKKKNLHCINEIKRFQLIFISGDGGHIIPIPWISYDIWLNPFILNLSHLCTSFNLLKTIWYRDQRTYRKTKGEDDVWIVADQSVLQWVAEYFKVSELHSRWSDITAWSGILCGYNRLDAQSKPWTWCQWSAQNTVEYWQEWCEDAWWERLLFSEVRMSEGGLKGNFGCMNQLKANYGDNNSHSPVSVFTEEGPHPSSVSTQAQYSDLRLRIII